MEVSGSRWDCATYLPSIAQGNQVVDIDVAGSSPGSAIVGAEPASARSGAGRASNYIGAVALEHCLAGVAGSGLGDPVGEQVAGVAILWALSGDGQARELGASLAC
jgi:hypothetical protein